MNDEQLLDAIVFCPISAEDARRLAAQMDVGGYQKVALVFLPSARTVAEEWARTNPNIKMLIEYPQHEDPHFYYPAFLESLRRLKSFIADGTVGAAFFAGVEHRYLPGIRRPNYKRDFNLIQIFHDLALKRMVAAFDDSAECVEVPELLTDYIGTHSGRAGWILGNGPSLRGLDLSFLKDEVTFVANKGYLLQDSILGAPTYWMGVDSLQMEFYSEEWPKNLDPKTTPFFPAEYLGLLEFDHGCAMNTFPAAFPDNLTNFRNPQKMFFRSETDSLSNSAGEVYLGHSVIAPMIQVFNLMGCNPIFLLGVDHDYGDIKSKNFGEIWETTSGGDHFSPSYGETESGGKRKFHPPDLERFEAQMMKVSHEASSQGLKIFNASASSKLRSFPRITIESARKPLWAAKAKKSVNGTTDRQTVTIAISTGDIESVLFKTCIAHVREHASKHTYEIIVLDNKHASSFSHAKNMNRALLIAQTEHVIFLDEDVRVTAGWIEALFGQLGPNVGVVGLHHWDGKTPERRAVKHSGAHLDEFGTVTPVTKSPEEAFPAQFVSSAAILVTDKRLKFSEDYEKYYFDADYCFQTWLEGREVRVAPHAVFHDRHGTLIQNGLLPADVKEISGRDRTKFLQNWISTGLITRVNSEFSNASERDRRRER